jgi:putative glutamine amidotransferase
MREPLIGITAPVRDSDIGMPRVVVEAGYLQASRVAGALPIVLSPLDDLSTRHRIFCRVNGLLLSGGEDVDPGRYGREPDGARSVSPERDAMELDLVARAIEHEIPILAICRGIQLLNVALGGTLCQDLFTQRGQAIDHDRYREFDGHIHAIHTSGAELLSTAFSTETFVQNSAHHQGIDELSPDLTAVAWAEDGLIEAVEYRAPGAAWTCGVQWHPERKIEEATGTNRRLFEVFGEQMRRTVPLGGRGGPCD